MTKGPESVIPAQAGIQAIELNDKTTGCPRAWRGDKLLFSSSMILFRIILDSNEGRY